MAQSIHFPASVKNDVAMICRLLQGASVDNIVKVIFSTSRTFSVGQGDVITLDVHLVPRPPASRHLPGLDQSLIK